MANISSEILLSLNLSHMLNSKYLAKVILQKKGSCPDIQSLKNKYKYGKFDVSLHFALFTLIISDSIIDGTEDLYYIVY